MGQSLSSSLALINHSCDPNCIQFHVGQYAILVPMRRIAEVRIKLNVTGGS